MAKKLKLVKNGDGEGRRCSFCNKASGEIEKLVANPSDRPARAYICNECIAVYDSILESEKKTAPK